MYRKKHTVIITYLLIAVLALGMLGVAQNYSHYFSHANKEECPICQVVALKIQQFTAAITASVFVQQVFWCISISETQTKSPISETLVGLKVRMDN